MTVWAALARLVGCREDQAEELLASPEHARQAALRISRRGLFLGAGAVAAGSAFSFADPFDDERARVLRMATRIVKSYMDQRLVSSFGVECASLDPATRTLNVRVWVNPLAWSPLLEPINCELGFK